MTHRFITTAIPYVNAPPHIGFALELVIADVLVRHERQRGTAALFLSGTDDNSLKNALAARDAGVSTRDFVTQRAREFQALRRILNVSYDDFLRTSADPRHPPAVEKLWRACARRGDIYSDDYTGLYCVGCEQFYTQSDLPGGLCAEHGSAPERVRERNYFFRLSRYQDELLQLIRRDEVAIRPVQRKNEVLAFLEAPLVDLSISRSVDRARGWGLPVPGDPSQIVYVWLDALTNYISALDYGGHQRRLHSYWTGADRISHVIGKGVIRFHAVYWPAILLSAGLRPPSEILVHGYVTSEGRKISKSRGNTVSPAEAAAAFGTDALRYYLLRHVGSHHDGDFSWSRLAEIYEHELANDLGNLLSRTTALGRKFGAPAARESVLAQGLPEEVNRHVNGFVVHRALDAIWETVGAANAFVNRTEPWKLAKRGEAGALEDVLAELYATVRRVGDTLTPFLPDAAHRLIATLEASSAQPLFPRSRAPEHT